MWQVSIISKSYAENDDKDVIIACNNFADAVGDSMVCVGPQRVQTAKG